MNKARDAGEKVKWIPSLGHDPNSRETVLSEAVEKGRISAKHAAGLLPYRDLSTTENKLLQLVKQEEGFSKISSNLKIVNK